MKTLIKRWTFYDSETDILDFLFTDLSKLCTILFMAMGKKWRKVICFVKLSHGTTTQR